VVATGPNNIKEWQAISIKGKYLNQKVWNIDTELSETIGGITTVSLPSANVGDLVYSSENRVLGYVSDTIFGEKEVITAVYVPPLRKVRSSDGTVAVVENEYNFDLSIQSEINARRQADSALQANINAEAKARKAADGAIEAKARQIDVSDNSNGTFTFTNYDGNSKTIQSGKKVQSSDGTVAVAENADNFDLSVQEVYTELDAEISRAAQAEADLRQNINAINAKINQSVEQSTSVLSDEDSVSISTDSINLFTQTPSNNTIDLPVASNSSAGVMDSTMFRQFVRNTANISELFDWVQSQGRVALAHLGGTTSQATITNAFNLVYPGTINDKDTVIDLDDTGHEWMHSNGVWVNLTVQPLNLASTAQDGIAADNNVDGGITYQIPGKGQLVGWSDLKARVATAEGNISGLQTSVGNIQAAMQSEYVYGVSVTGKVLTYNLRNISTGAARAATVDLPNAFTGVSYSGNTFTFTKADGTKQTQAITLEASNVSGLAAVATTGSYSDLADKPDTPAGVSQRANLGSTAAANSITASSIGVTGTLPIASGGTGQTTAAWLTAQAFRGDALNADNDPPAGNLNDAWYTTHAYQGMVQIASNGPEGITGWYFLINMPHRYGTASDGASFGNQVVFGPAMTATSTNPKIWARARNNSATAWGPWHRVADASVAANVDGRLFDSPEITVGSTAETRYFKVFDRAWNSSSGGLVGFIVNAAGYAGKADYTDATGGHKLFTCNLYQQGNNALTANSFSETWLDDKSTWSTMWYLVEGLNTANARLRIWMRQSPYGGTLKIKFLSKYDAGGWLSTPVDDGGALPAGATHFPSRMLNSALGVPIKAIQTVNQTGNTIPNKDVYYYLYGSPSSNGGTITVELFKMTGLTNNDIGKIYTFMSNCENTNPPNPILAVKYKDNGRSPSAEQTANATYKNPVRLMFVGLINNEPKFLPV
jgi:molybdopterin converting factor small subunit